MLVTDNKQQGLVIIAFWLALSSVTLRIMPLLILCALEALAKPFADATERVPPVHESPFSLIFGGPRSVVAVFVGGFASASLVYFQGQTSFAGLAGFSVFMLLPMWFGSLLAWLTSLVMVVIIAFRCRPLLFTKMGIATLLMQEGILVCIGAIAVSIIYK